MPTRRVLVIDDDPEFVKDLSNALRDAGYEMLTASDGSGAAPILSGEHRDFDLAVVDLVLPGSLSGFDLISIMTRERQSFKIVATSAVYKDAVLKYVAEQLGADAYIEKNRPGEPFNAEMWVGTVRRLLAEGAAPAATR